MVFETVINGLPVRAVYSEANIREVFVPLLKRLSEERRRRNRRVLAFLAAPPGAGKSTLAAFLSKLAAETPGLLPLTAVGMDGFHLRQEYLTRHTTVRDGRQVRLVEIKGAPETFDAAALLEAVQKVAAGEECEWPEYDRLLHNPVYAGRKVTGDIVLLEGNYLLLDEDGWRELRHYADYTVRIQADPALLRDRLVQRKADSGMPRADAGRFVDFSDLHNARLCMEKTLPADLNLVLMPDGGYAREPEAGQA